MKIALVHDAGLDGARVITAALAELGHEAEAVDAALQTSRLVVRVEASAPALILDGTVPRRSAGGSASRSP